jgi:hypothetical protein
VVFELAIIDGGFGFQAFFGQTNADTEREQSDTYRRKSCKFAELARHLSAAGFSFLQGVTGEKP